MEIDILGDWAPARKGNLPGRVLGHLLTKESICLIGVPLLVMLVFPSLQRAIQIAVGSV